MPQIGGVGESAGKCEVVIPAENDHGGKQKTQPVNWLGSIRMAATYSPTLLCSTIGHGGLNFSVRNGKR